MRKPDVDLEALARLVDRAVPGSGRPTIERTSDGVSTQVYRIRRDGHTFYLRVAEDQQDRLVADVLVHRRLGDLGVKVPAIVHLEAFDEALERSILITTEIAGHSLAKVHAAEDVQSVLVAAGRDLAVINSVEVAGFGWIRRDQPVVTQLEAERPTHRGFVLGDLEASLDLLRRHFFAAEETDAIRQALSDDDDWLNTQRAYLVHGDFDVSHIFHRDGEYTGIIDFGEIRGADRLYDLGHFALHEGESLPMRVFPHLLEGYRQVMPVSDDQLSRIYRNALLIGVGRFARSVGRPAADYQDFMTRAIRRSLHAIPS